MLQAAIAIVRCVQHEHIVGMRRLAPEVNFLLTDFLGIAQQAFAIKRSGSTGHDKAVWHATGGKAATPEVAHFHRAVHQLVIVRSRIQAKALGIGIYRSQPGRQLPCGGLRAGADMQLVCLGFLTMHTQQQAGAVEEATALVQPSSAHRSVIRADFVAQLQRLTGLAVQLPLVLAQLLDSDGMAALLRLQVLQVFGEFTHQVAPGYPYGE